MHNPSQVSVIQSEASAGIDFENMTNGSVSNRMSFRNGMRFGGNFEEFAPDGGVKQGSIDGDEPMSPGLNSRKLRR